MPGPEHVTPRRARPLGTIWWLQKRGLLKTSKTGTATHNDNGDRLYSKLEVFADFNIARRTGLRWLSAIPEDLHEQNNSVEAGLEVNCKEATIRDRMRDSFKYHICKSTVKDGLNNSAKKARIQWVQDRLREGKYDNDKWLKTTFSMDEVHFGFQPSLTTKVHRRPKDKYEWWTVQAEEAAKKKKKLKNAKITIKNEEKDPQGAQELEDENEQTLLHAETQKWLKDNHRELIIGPGLSPDLNWIETNIRRVKYHVKNTPHLTTKDQENIIDEGWRKVAQKKLNDDVASLKERLQQVLKAGGDRIAY
ncbi:hypothetical protein Micbo1qcDRAFT_209834 [Microdochium bolleyi]|uniref:Tc1-like transposase DDE domain-containing protein n=1 Tax=Microdochium bolleyi TaxID=196109 RepID=A0A136IKZ9_9PEZI|nr:hypothetical protein Micbo1qcDRAFT_209834 [Microdochium bolleyi]